MVHITFETHSTTVDNENQVCSGHFDAKLSELGKQQAKELGVRRAGDNFAAIFCSDLSRAVDTADLAFGKRFPIIQDARLRECDYGDFEHCTRQVMNVEQLNRISTPFPNGESYEQAFRREGDFLNDLLRDYDSKRVLIIGHGATRSGLEYWLNGRSATEALLAARTWAPGWDYELAAKLDIV